MRPRVDRRANERATPIAPKRSAAVLRSVESVQAAAATSRELWIGVCLRSPTPSTLEQLATRAQRFTPRVSVVPPDGLLLEVKGSLHLFGGAETLLRTLEAECVHAGAQPNFSLAPTSLAAMVGARNGASFRVSDQAKLVGQLSALPLSPLRWPQEVVDRLAGMGVRTIGQALRLPRSGFARRLGTELLDELDRLIGRKPDLRQRFQPRVRFRRRRELLCELENLESIRGAIEPVLEELGKFLQARQCGLMQLECLLRHRHASPSSCLLHLSAPLADVTRLGELLGERLSTLALPEPVRSFELRSGELIPRAFTSSGLWRPGEHGGGVEGESTELVERLRSRLGSEAVYGLQVLPGHRPESTWRATEPAPVRAAATVRTPWPGFRRPLWLLREPQALRARNGLPRWRGSLSLTGEVERIETAWWDADGIERDYYTARGSHGVCLWVFRERSAPYRWFLHGVFG
jgi:protein ImuB